MHMLISVTSCGIHVGNQVWFEECLTTVFPIIPFGAYIIPVFLAFVLSYMLHAKCRAPWILLFLSVVTWHQVKGL